MRPEWSKRDINSFYATFAVGWGPALSRTSTRARAQKWLKFGTGVRARARVVAGVEHGCWSSGPVRRNARLRVHRTGGRRRGRLPARERSSGAGVLRTHGSHGRIRDRGRRTRAEGIVGPARSRIAARLRASVRDREAALPTAGRPQNRRRRRSHVRCPERGGVHGRGDGAAAHGLRGADRRADPRSAAPSGAGKNHGWVED